MNHCYTVAFVCRFSQKRPVLAVRCRADNSHEAFEIAVSRVCKKCLFDGWHTDDSDFQFGDFYRRINNSCVSFDESSSGRLWKVFRGFVNDFENAVYI